MEFLSLSEEAWTNHFTKPANKNEMNYIENTRQSEMNIISVFQASN